MSSLELLESITGYVQRSTPDQRIRLGIIDPAYVSSTYPGTLPKVTFDGETTLSGKQYTVIGPYRPSPNDRVALIPVGATYAIIGALTTTASALVGGDLTVSGDATISGDATVAGASVPRGVIGGKYYTGSNRAVGIIGVESLGNIDTGSVSMLSGRLYLIVLKLKVSGSVTGDEFLLRVRDTNTSGTVRGEIPWHNSNSGVGWTLPLFAFRYSPASDETKTFVLTAQRLSGSGSINVETGGATNPAFMLVEDAGLVGAVTLVS